MAIHNITDSALLVNKSRRTIQRYIANGKLTMVADALGNPKIDTAELIRVFGALSKVSQKRLIKKSQNVAVKLSKKNNTISITNEFFMPDKNHPNTLFSQNFRLTLDPKVSRELCGGFAFKPGQCLTSFLADMLFCIISVKNYMNH